MLKKLPEPSTIIQCKHCNNVWNLSYHQVCPNCRDKALNYLEKYITDNDLVIPIECYECLEDGHDLVPYQPDMHKPKNIYWVCDWCMKKLSRNPHKA